MIDAGWWTDAGRELNEIVEENGDLPRAHYLLATIYLRELDMGRRTHWDEAEDHAKKAVELDGSDVENLMILGHIMGIKARDGSKLSAMGRAKTAKGSYEKAVELQPDNLQARKWLINFHMNAPGFAGGDKEEARRQAEAVAKIDPVEGHYSHADIYEFLDKDLAKAEEELKAALAAQPDESKTYYMYANFLSRNGRYEDAVKQMKALAAVEPASSGPWFGIGTYAERAERWDEAAGQYEKLAAVDSTRRDAMMRLGFLGQKQEKWDEALAGFQAAWSEDPEYYYALYQVGKTNLLGEIDLAAAEAAFKEYISARTREDGPSKADAYWRLAMVYDAMGERKQAKAACKQATKLDSKHEQAKKLYKKLKRR
jgi:tetratricopeptide (TPR) repeat protein